MNDLPSLVVDGGAVWVAALVVLVALPALASALVVRSRARSRAASALRSLGEPGPAPRAEGAWVTLDGVLRGRSGDACPVATTVSNPAAKGVLSSFGAAGLELDVDGEIVGVEGTVVVRCGSHELGPIHFAWLPETKQRELARGVIGAESLARYDAVIVARSVASGDRVRVRGALRRIGVGDHVHGYRGVGASWSLVLEDRDGSGLAFLGARRLAASMARARCRGVGAGLALFVVALLAGGVTIVPSRAPSARSTSGAREHGIDRPAR